MAQNLSHDDLLGDPDPTSSLSRELFTPGSFAPGKCVDLSGASSMNNGNEPQSLGPSSGGSSYMRSSGGSGSGSSNSYSYSNNAGSSGYSNGVSGNQMGFGSNDRGPTSMEGGGGASLSLSSLTPQNIMRALAAKPVTELITENSKNLINIPRYAARAYTAAAKRYLRPWNEFLRLRPGRIVEGFRGAHRRGEIQIFVQRNALANARNFCPNYAFLFLATLFMFVATSPMLLCMLGTVGGGWSHMVRGENFRNRPWQLQLGSVSVPLGSNMKSLIMALPTLLFLHFFMGPVLWSAALCSGGASLGHAALRDRDDDADMDDHGDVGGSPHV